jgi:endonuclease/exonuclease/phosphatase family metal-dependent hydrolase
MICFRTVLTLFLVLGSLIAGLPANAKEAPEIKLLSLNTWQFPYGLVSSNNYQRASKMAEVIREKNEEYDVIALQEMWSNQTRRYFYEKIKDLYPYRSEDNQWGYLVLGFHSGLAIYSKYPITRHVQHTFKNFRGIESFAKKGILGVELEVKQEPVFVFTTHLQAGPGGRFFQWWDQNKPPTHEISILELQEARAAMNQFIQNRCGLTLLIGDFNIDAGNEEYRNALAALDPVYDTFDESRSKYRGTSWNNPSLDNRIDYIMSLDHHPDGYSVITDSFGADVTDHLGVVGNFYLPDCDRQGSYL